MADTDGIIVIMTGDDSCRVVKPIETDSLNIKTLKLFILSCLHRRLVDDTFDQEMHDWLMNYNPEDFEEIMQRNAQKDRMN